MADIAGRVLALSWVMPPLVFPRSLQVARTLKALSGRGWDVSVVTAWPDAEPHGIQDPALGAFYQDSYRVVAVEPREEIVPSSWWLRKWRSRFPPDDLNIANWVFRARRLLLSELSSRRYDVLVTFAQPWIDHVIGCAVKRRRERLPWLAHFSDPWTDSPYLRTENADERLRMAREEHDVISSADGLAFVTEEAARLVMAKYPHEWKEKAFVVKHGYDKDLLEALPTLGREQDKLRIVHSGSFYPGMREPIAFLEALATLILQPEVRAALHVDFIGYAPVECAERSKALGLDQLVHFHGKQPYLESLAVAAQADLLLLVDAPVEHNVFLPSKIADYLMLDKPILGLTPAAGASAEVLRKLDYPVVSPLDIPGIASELTTLFERWRAGGLHSSPQHKQVSADFDVRHTTQAFEEALLKTIQRTRGVRASARAQ